MTSPCLFLVWKGTNVGLKIMDPLWSLLLYCSVAKLCPALCHPMDCSRAGSPVLQYFLVFLRFMSVESVMLSNHLILCHPLLLLPSVFPRIKVFSNMSAPHIRWPKYWSFSFSISPSNEYSGLISFKIDCFDLLAVQEALKSLSNTTVWKHQSFGTQVSLWSNSHINIWLLEKP